MTDQNVVTADERNAVVHKIDAALFRGDLSKLTDEERLTHVYRVSSDIGINPATGALQYITLNNRLVLYVTKGGTDQLRKIHGISLAVVSRTVSGDLLTVHVRATDKNGRTDEDFGVVSLAGLRGEAAANAMMKAVTKAKRRATLSAIGLGFLDESEVDDIPGAKPFANLVANPGLTEATGPSPGADTVQKEEPPVEIEPYELEINERNSEEEWKRWGNDLFAYIKAAKTFERVDEWIVANSDGFEALKHWNVGMFNKLRHMIQAVQDGKPKAARDDAG